MINLKKIDDKDFVFINKTLSDKEEKEFSEFLKTRKTKILVSKNSKKTNTLQS